MDEVKSFSWANSSSMDMPFSDKAQGLRASPNGYPAVVIGFDVYNMSYTGDVSKTLNSVATDSDHIPVAIVLNDQGGSVMNVSDKAGCLRAQDHGHPPVICFEPGIAKREGNADRFVNDKSTTLRANIGDNQPAVCFQNTGHGWWNESNIAQTIRTPCGGDSTKANLVMEKTNCLNNRKYILRRLTPMECARLQGFPDWWTDGVDGSDSNKYKMWGNGIALPCAADVIGRIAKEFKEED